MAENLGVETKALIQNVPTRWDSVYLMLKRLLNFRTVLDATVANAYETRDESDNKVHYKIPASNFNKIEIIVKAFELLADLTKQLSLRDSSVANILPIYYVFMKHWGSNVIIDDDEVAKIRQKVSIGLRKRIDAMKSYSSLMIATIFDPRYKDSVFSPSDRTNTFKLVVSELKKLSSLGQPNDNNGHRPAKRPKIVDNLDFMKDALDEMDGRRHTMAKSDSKLIEDEINAYLKEPRISYKSDPSATLYYWRVSKFVLLKKLAQ